MKKIKILKPTILKILLLSLISVTFLFISHQLFFNDRKEIPNNCSRSDWDWWGKVIPVKDDRPINMILNCLTFTNVPNSSYVTYLNIGQIFSILTIIYFLVYLLLRLIKLIQIK